MTMVSRNGDAQVQIPADELLSDAKLHLDLSKMELVLLDMLQNALENALEQGGRVLLRSRSNGYHATIEVVHDASELALHRTPVAMRGLNVALEVVADHGGSLDVQSTGSGTTYELRLPVVSRERQSA